MYGGLHIKMGNTYKFNRFLLGEKILQKEISPQKERAWSRLRKRPRPTVSIRTNGSGATAGRSGKSELILRYKCNPTVLSWCFRIDFSPRPPHKFAPPPCGGFVLQRGVESGDESGTTCTFIYLKPSSKKFDTKNSLALSLESKPKKKDNN